MFFRLVVTIDHFKDTLDLGLIAVITATLPYLRKNTFRGRIVFDAGSGTAAKGVPDWGTYCASKVAMDSLCRQSNSPLTFAIFPTSPFVSIRTWAKYILLLSDPVW